MASDPKTQRQRFEDPPQQYSPPPPHYESLADLPDRDEPTEHDHDVDDNDEEIQALPRIHHAPHSSHPPRRGARRGSNGSNGGRGTNSSAPSRLGAIDEQSNTVAPDIPTRNPKRKLYGPNFSKHKYLTLAYYLEKENVPPVDAYDNVIGPRGEKFNDLRRNKPHSPQGRRSWRKLTCLGLIIAVIIAIALGIGLGVGLTRRKSTSQNNSSSSSGSSNSGNQNSSAPFPIGTYTIPTFLSAINTSCTADPSTWRCYPYTTYSPSSASSSYSATVWQITSPDNSTLDLDITSTQPTFSYPFSNVSLTLSDWTDNTRAAFTFAYVFTKTVVPTDDITGTGVATRCHYVNTLLSVRLYATAHGAGGNITSPPTTSGTLWPYAVEYEETSAQGPECYVYVNGADTTRVNVAAGSGTCACDYRNFDL